MSDAGIIENGAIGFADSVIQYVGPAKESYDSVATVVDLDGQVITPGLVDVHSTLGARWEKGQQLYDALVAQHFHFSGSQIEEMLSHGITSVVLRPPEDSLFGGFSALVRVLPDTLGGPQVLEDSLDYQISLLGTNWWTPGIRERSVYEDMERVYRLRETIRQLDNPAYAGIDFSPLDATETVVKAVQQNIPIYFLVDERLHYFILRELLADRQIRYYYGQGKGIVEYLQSLKDQTLQNFPGMIIGPSAYCFDETEDRFYSIPSELVEHGMDFSLASFAPVNPSKALLNKAQRVMQYGVSEFEALSSITSIPAGYIEQSDQIGSLHQGADATFLIFNGNPMEMTSAVTETYIRGQRVWRQK